MVNDANNTVAGSISPSQDATYDLGTATEQWNVIYGHTHDLQRFTETGLGGTQSAWSLGCLKDMSSEKNAWLGNRPINWAHGFAIVDFYKGGLFTVHIIQIIKGRTSLWGELIEGK